MYPTMLTRGPDADVEPYYCLPVGSMQAAKSGVANVPWSQPTSPTPPSRFSGPLSPTHPTHRLTYPKKNDDGKWICSYFNSCSLLSDLSSNFVLHARVAYGLVSLRPDNLLKRCRFD